MLLAIEAEINYVFLSSLCLRLFWGFYTMSEDYFCDFKKSVALWKALNLLEINLWILKGRISVMI